MRHCLSLFTSISRPAAIVLLLFFAFCQVTARAMDICKAEALMDVRSLGDTSTIVFKKGEIMEAVTQ